MEEYSPPDAERGIRGLTLSTDELALGPLASALMRYRNCLQMLAPAGSRPC